MLYANTLFVIYYTIFVGKIYNWYFDVRLRLLPLLNNLPTWHKLPDDELIIKYTFRRWISHISWGSPGGYFRYVILMAGGTAWTSC